MNFVAVCYYAEYSVKILLIRLRSNAVLLPRTRRRCNPSREALGGMNYQIIFITTFNLSSILVNVLKNMLINECYILEHLQQILVVGFLKNNNSNQRYFYCPPACYNCQYIFLNIIKGFLWEQYMIKKYPQKNRWNPFTNQSKAYMQLMQASRTKLLWSSATNKVLASTLVFWNI